MCNRCIRGGLAKMIRIFIRSRKARMVDGSFADLMVGADSRFPVPVSCCEQSIARFREPTVEQQCAYVEWSDVVQGYSLHY